MSKLATNLAYEDWQFEDCVTESQNSDISWQARWGAHRRRPGTHTQIRLSEGINGNF